MLILMKRLRHALVSYLPGVVAATAVLMPIAAFAQEAAPDPDISGTPTPIYGFIVMFLMIAVVVSISLMPSKRGHQN